MKDLRYLMVNTGGVFKIQSNIYDGVLKRKWLTTFGR